MTEGRQTKETNELRQRQMRLTLALKNGKSTEKPKKQLPPGKKGGTMVKAGSSKSHTTAIGKGAIPQKQEKAQEWSANFFSVLGRGLVQRMLLI